LRSSFPTFCRSNFFVVGSVSGPWAGPREKSEEQINRRHERRQEKQQERGDLRQKLCQQGEGRLRHPPRQGIERGKEWGAGVGLVWGILDLFYLTRLLVVGRGN
jgi:hypothetical protein